MDPPLATPSGRRLAAIVAIDVAGYSRLVRRDDRGAAQELKEHQAAIVKLARQFGGAVVDLAGDGALAEFGSAVDAVEFAVATQHGAAEHNKTVPAEAQMLLRIGVNLGDILHDGSRIFGDGVNVAARLEALSPSGGVCVSRAILDQVRGKVTLPFVGLGPQALKNIDDPVEVFTVPAEAVAAVPTPNRSGTASRRRSFLRRAAPIVGLVLLAGIGSAGWLVFDQFIAQKAEIPPITDFGRPRIGVLPVADLGGKADAAYFADGLTEDIITALGRYPELSVLSRNAVLPYKGKAVPPAQVGAELGARYVAEASLRRTDEALRISVQLVDAKTGVLLWSQRYETKPEEIFSVQDDITRRIVGALAVRLTKLEQTRSAAKPPSNLEAYDLVLRGRALRDQLRRSANAAATSLFKQAIALDPNYAPAYVGLGETETARVNFGWTGDPAAALDRAEAAARKAISLDDALSSAHVLLGAVYSRRRDFGRAIEAYNRAVQINSSDWDIYDSLGEALLWSGDAGQATKMFELVHEMNPSREVGNLWNMGAAYFLFGRNAEAISTFERVVSRDEKFSYAYYMLAAAYAEDGRLEAASQSATRARALNPLFKVDDFAAQFQNARDRARILTAFQKAGFKNASDL